MKAFYKGNLAMFCSKFFSGLNQNALKYLVPRWMSPLSGVVFRVGFGAVAFWITSFFTRKEATRISAKEKLLILLTGMTLMFGFMFLLLQGLKYNTPINSSIFISLQPMCVFIISAIFMHEKVTWSKVVGIILGIGGALMCILTQKTSAVATNPALGTIYNALSTICYSVYLIVIGRFVAKIDNVTVSKWCFSGATISAVIAVLIAGWDAPVLHHLISPAGLALAFVLIFPSFISYFLLNIGLKYLKTTVVSLYANLILIVSAIASYILGQDIFSWWQIAAIVLIIGSVVMVERSERAS